MLKNYIKVAFRNLWRNKGFSSINIIGLAIGLATCLLITIYVMDELSYDKFNKNADRIYRVDGDIQFGGTHFVLAVAPDQMGPTLVKDYPQVEQMVRFRGYGGFSVKKGTQNVVETRVIYTDPTLFDVFTLPMIAGNPKTALLEPHTMVISESMAKKYFNRTDVVGQSLFINDKRDYKITGVIKDVPTQSHFNFDFFVSLAESDEAKASNWLSNNFNTYVVLRKGVDPQFMNSKMPEVVRKYMGPQVQQFLGASLDEITKSGSHAFYTFTPLTSIHLHSDKVAELGANSSVEYVYIFSGIALLILLIACVNFMNLSTARSANRAKEVGVRKVLGSLRSTLVGQFLAESTLVCLISMILAILIAWLMLPYFNQLSAKDMNIGVMTRSWMLPTLLIIVVLVGLIAGSYPAFFLSSFQPIQVLKGKIAAGFKGSWLRSSLVVFQFLISIFLFVGTIVIYNQISFIRNKKIGFNREHVLNIHNCYALGDQAKTFKNEIAALPGVEGATMTGYLPTGPYRNDNPYFMDATLDQKKAISMQSWDVDENYIPVLGMELATGRNFSDQLKTDSNAMIINEAAAKLMGLTDPVNTKIYSPKDIDRKKIEIYTIIGVVKDFNFNSLRQQVTPLALFLRKENGTLALRIHTTEIPHLVNEIENKWRTMAPSQPFSYSFMDDDFNAIYRSEERMGRISLSFSILAICIACLGLFGLAAYAAEQRTKEIGIRKVLGATVSNIIGMLSKDFLKLVIISMLIAFPFAWWAMHRWLQDFAYRISIGWWIFVAAGGLAILIALVTVSFQAIKAALANPVKSLRTE